MVLRLAPDTVRVAFGSLAHRSVPPSTLSAGLENLGSVPRWVVQPGDGSLWGWRLPVIGWSVVPDLPDTTHPATWPGPPPGGRCGNMNGYIPEDFVLLEPGMMLALDRWVDAPRVPGPGRYRILLYYVVDPLMTQRDRAALRFAGYIERLRPLALRSNEVVLVVDP